jgi:hypothetical protein
MQKPWKGQKLNNHFNRITKGGHLSTFFYAITGSWHGAEGILPQVFPQFILRKNI